MLQKTSEVKNQKLFIEGNKRLSGLVKCASYKNSGFENFKKVCERQKSCLIVKRE